MMNRFTFLFLILVFPLFLYGQVFFGSDNVIEESETYSLSFENSVDIDGDGNLDMIASFDSEPDKIVWYKYEESIGNFGEPQTIFEDFLSVRDIRVVDIDGDGDMDVFSTLNSEINRIVWYKNLDGLGNFGEPQTIFEDSLSLGRLGILDIDSDGDMDIVGRYSLSTSKIVWYENLDGLGNFGEQVTIIDEISDYISSTFFSDIDNDSDLDIFTYIGGYFQNTEFVWYENLDGQLNFSGKIVIESEVDSFISPIFSIIDIDNDNDLDILYSYEKTLYLYEPDNEFEPPYRVYESKIAWYEFEDGFGEQQLIYKEVDIAEEEFYDRPARISPTDIDGDGDLDLLIPFNIIRPPFGPYNQASVYWIENEDGLGSFGERNFIADNYWSETYDKIRKVYSVDFDNDGDKDVLSIFPDKITWNENEDGLGGFGDERNILTDLSSVAPSDIDNDGFPDLIGSISSKVIWKKNLYGSPTLSGICFYDENENGIKDEGDLGLGLHTVGIQPDAIASFSNGDGEFNFYIDVGAYTISSQIPNDWFLTSDSASYTVFLQDTTIQNLNFGLKPLVEIDEVQPDISSAATRCGFQVPFWLNYENTGTTFSSGYVSLTIDNLASYLSANIEPDSISGNTLFWNYDNLPPTHNASINLQLQMPGVEHLGETVSFNATAFITDSTGIVQDSFSYEYTSVINCAYDPNDKMARPAGVQDEAYTLFGEELEYTVRFQNTGTDTAFTVRIEDQLDENLDWSTFRPIAASHPYEVSVFEGGLVEFTFNNILLPDSIVNEVESHGFLKYRILPLGELAENTPIENTADIFFDFNPPIQTNTTLNTMVSEIPTTGTKDIGQSIIVEVYPNPFEQQTTFAIGSLPKNSSAILNIRTIDGKLIQSQTVQSNTTVQLDLKVFPASIYFYELKMEGTGEVLTSGKLVKQ